MENALRHTDPGTAVEASVERRNGEVVLAVEDDGPGIADEHAPHVFDRFYRIEGDVASGSGLGLAIARELAALMGGSVELVSARSPTSFALLLPLAGPAAERFPVETAAPAS
jgi:signal transduction histidine kinase